MVLGYTDLSVDYAITFCLSGEDHSWKNFSCKYMKYFKVYLFRDICTNDILPFWYFFKKKLCDCQGNMLFITKFVEGVYIMRSRKFCMMLGFQKFIMYVSKEMRVFSFSFICDLWFLNFFLFCFDCKIIYNAGLITLKIVL